VSLSLIQGRWRVVRIPFIASLFCLAALRCDVVRIHVDVHDASLHASQIGAAGESCERTPHKAALKIRLCVAL
jgi:hypothetical protein